MRMLITTVKTKMLNIPCIWSWC